MGNAVLQLDPRDNVLIALKNLRQGERIDFSGHTYVLTTDVHAKHKFATADLAAGADLIMYGVLIGKARQPISAGEALTTSNTVHEATSYHEKSGEYEWTSTSVDRWRQRTFRGFERPDGQVGTRNIWLVVPLVFCENRNIDVLKQAFEEELGFAPPKIYRQQVADMVRLYREGAVVEIATRTAEQDLHLPTHPKVFENIDGVKFLMHE